MKFSDVISLTQSALAQSMGDEYMTKLGNLSALPVDKLVDVGRDILDTDNTLEKFTKALVSVIGNFEIINLNVKEEFSDLYVGTMEWGGFLERAYYGLAEFIEDPMWNTINGKSYADIENKFYQPSVSAKIFNECKAGMIPISIQRDTLKEAFTNFDTLNRYVSGIYATVQNTIKMIKKAYARMLVSTGIAESVKATRTAVHLLTEAKERGIISADATSKTALANKDFLAYASMRIASVRDYMKVESNKYNNGSVIASADDTKLKVLTEFEKSLRYTLRADTYNEKLVSLSDYESITSWQGVTDGENAFNFENLSKIMIEADANNKLGLGTEAVTIENCVAVAFDSRAIGFTFDKIKITSNYTACADFWNEFTHIWVNTIVDTNCPIVAFILD